MTVAATGSSPLESLAVAKVSSFSQLLRGMSKTAFAGRQFGEAFDVLLEMARASECHVVLTLSGAMTVAKQGQIVCDLIERGIVSTVVATGALIAHGLTESIGLTHYRYDPTKSDETLLRAGLQPHLRHARNGSEPRRRRAARQGGAQRGVTAEAGCGRPRALSRLSASDSANSTRGPGFCAARSSTTCRSSFRPSPTARSAWMSPPGRCRHGSIATDRPQQLDCRRTASSGPGIQSVSRPAGVRAPDRRHATTLGIFTIGGGVPRNWAQQVAPYYDITAIGPGTTSRCRDSATACVSAPNRSTGAGSPAAPIPRA